MVEEARKVKIMGLAASDEEEDDGEEENFDEDRPCVNSVISDWWNSVASERDMESIESSNKFKLVFEILKECEAKDEKWLVMSIYLTAFR